MCAFSTANESFPTLKQFLWFPFHRIDLKFRKITREKRQQLPWVQWEEKKQENRIKTNAWDTNTCTTAFCTNFWLSSMQPPYTHTYTHTRNYCCSLAAHRRRVLHTVQCMYVPYVFLYVYLYSFIRSTLFRFHFVTLLYKFSGFFSSRLHVCVLCHRTFLSSVYWEPSWRSGKRRSVPNVWKLTFVYIRFFSLALLLAYSLPFSGRPFLFYLYACICELFYIHIYFYSQLLFSFGSSIWKQYINIFVHFSSVIFEFRFQDSIK